MNLIVRRTIRATLHQKLLLRADEVIE